jgi:hypothetical protein
LLFSKTPFHLVLHARAAFADFLGSRNSVGRTLSSKKEVVAIQKVWMQIGTGFVARRKFGGGFTASSWCGEISVVNSKLSAPVETLSFIGANKSQHVRKEI